MQDRKSSALLSLANHTLFAPYFASLVRYGAMPRSIAGLLICAFLAATIARTDAQPPNAALAKSSERHWRGNAFQAQSPAPAKTPPGTNPAPSVVTQAEGPASRFALAVKASTLGLGADLGVRIFRSINVRVGFSTFHFTTDLSHDGTGYEGSLRLGSVQTVVDWFPFSRSFHVSSGVVFHNSNHITATSTIPPGQVQTSGSITYVSDPQNPISGRAQSDVRTVAPILTVGLGNLVPPRHHFSYSLDFGVVYQGHPKSSFTLQGAACDPSGTPCSNVADDSGTQAQIRSAQRDLDRSVRFMRYYPVISVAFGYRF